MREVDRAVAEEIKRVSSLNPYSEPIFRAIWSPDVTQYVAGWWNDYDSVTGAFIRRVFEARRGPKYQMAPRWIIERWMPAEFFGDREMWEAMTAEWSAQHGVVLELGPYPARGEYVHLWTCQNARGEYMELTPTLARYTIDLSMQPKPSNAELLAYKRARKEQDAKDLSFALDDMLGDAFPFLGRVNNLNPKPLMQKIREQKKDGKEL